MTTEYGVWAYTRRESSDLSLRRSAVALAPENIMQLMARAGRLGRLIYYKEVVWLSWRDGEAPARARLIPLYDEDDHVR